MTAIKQCLLFCLCFSLVLCQFGYQRYNQESQYENRNYNNRGNYGYRENQSGYGRNLFNVLPDVVRQVSNSWQNFSPQIPTRPYNNNQNPNNYQQPSYNPPSTYHYHDPNFYQNSFQNPNYQNQYPNNYPNSNGQIPNFNNNEQVPNFNNNEQVPNFNNNAQVPNFNNNGQVPNFNNNGQVPNFNNNEQVPNFNNNEQVPNFNNNEQVPNFNNNAQVPNFDVRFPDNIGNKRPEQNNAVNPTNDESYNETPYVFPDESAEDTGNNGQSDGIRIVETSDYQITPSTQPTESTTQAVTQPNFESRNMFFTGFSPTCRTPDKRHGSCISLLQCKEYLDLLQYSQNPTIISLLRKAACGFEGSTPKVCCPAKGLPTEPETEAPEPKTTTTTTVATPVVTGQPKSADDIFIDNLPEPPVCGVAGGPFSRVVNGVPAKLGLFPWMALLGYRGRKDPTAPRWLCGGSLISDKHVLTAAHCINGRDDLYQVRLGELDLAREDEGATPIDILIKTKIQHQEYSPTAFTNDIGILVLDQIVQFTSLIKPVCMPQSPTLRSATFETYTPFIAGWGDTEFRGPSAPHLQMAQLPVVTNDKCAQAYSAYKKQVIDQRVLCAGDQGGKDACQGDSGGPLMQPIFNGSTYHFYQIGVVSYGKKCAEPGFPGVYSRVTHFIPWILETVTGKV